MNTFWGSNKCQKCLTFNSFEKLLNISNLFDNGFFETYKTPKVIIKLYDVYLINPLKYIFILLFLSFNI